MSNSKEIVVRFRGEGGKAMERSYSEAVHGPDFKKLADEFTKKMKSRNQLLGTDESADEEESESAESGEQDTTGGDDQVPPEILGGSSTDTPKASGKTSGKAPAKSTGKKTS